VITQAVSLTKKTWHPAALLYRAPASPVEAGSDQSVCGVLAAERGDGDSSTEARLQGSAVATHVYIVYMFVFRSPSALIEKLALLDMDVCNWLNAGTPTWPDWKLTRLTQS
jgi:hypothetical protein